MATMSATHARKHFGDLLSLSEKTPVFIEKNGQQAAVVLSIETYDALVRNAPAGGVNPLVKRLFEESLKRHGGLYEALARGPLAPR